MGFSLLDLPEELIFKVLKSVDDYDSWKNVLEVPQLMARVQRNMTLITNEMSSTDTLLPFRVVNTGDCSHGLAHSEIYAVEICVNKPVEGPELSFLQWLERKRCFVNVRFIKCKTMENDRHSMGVVMDKLGSLENAVVNVNLGEYNSCLIDGASQTSADIKDVRLQCSINLKGHKLSSMTVREMNISASPVVSQYKLKSMDIKDCSSTTVHSLSHIIQTTDVVTITTTDSRVLSGSAGSFYGQSPSWNTIEFGNERYCIKGLTLNKPGGLRFDTIHSLRDFTINDASLLQESSFVISTVPQKDEETENLISPLLDGIHCDSLTFLTIIAYAKLPKFRNIHLPKLSQLRIILHIFNDVDYLEDIDPSADLDILRTVTDLSLENGLDLLKLKPEVFDNTRMITLVINSELEQLTKLDSLSLPNLESFELGCTNKDIDWQFPPTWNMSNLKTLNVSVEAWPRTWNLQDVSILHPYLETLCLAVPSDFGMVDSTLDGEIVEFPYLKRLTLCGVYYNKTVRYIFPQLLWHLLSVESPKRFYDYDIELPKLKTLGVELTGQLTRQKDDQKEEIEIKGFDHLERIYVDGFRKVSLFGTPDLVSLYVVSQRIDSLKSDTALDKLEKMTLKGAVSDKDTLLKDLNYSVFADLTIA